MSDNYCRRCGKRTDGIHTCTPNPVIAELQAEVEEQCRLNGMGSEREARLLARVEELERAAKMALDAIEGMSYWAQPRKTDEPELCGFEAEQGDKKFKKAEKAITALREVLGEKK